MRNDRHFGLAEFDRRALLSGASAMGGALLLPRGVAAQETPKRGGTLRVSMTYNPAALDPMTGRNAPDFNTLLAIYDGLLDLDPQTLAVKPALARAWKWANPTTLVLDLRDDVVFHDGTKFDAEAAKFNLDRYRTDQRSNVKPDASTIESVEITGAAQITLHLTLANSSLP